MPPAFDTKQLPSLRGVGLKAGTRAGDTQRYQRGVTQGARWQYDLNRQRADQAFRETELEQRKAEAEAGRKFTAGESQKGRDFRAEQAGLTRAQQRDLAGWGIGQTARAQDAAVIKTLVKGQGLGGTGTRGTGTGTSGVDATRSKMDVASMGKIETELEKLKKEIREGTLDEEARQANLDRQIELADARSRINQRYDGSKQPAPRGATIKTATGQDQRLNTDGSVVPVEAGKADAEVGKEEEKKKKKKLPRLKRGEVRTATGDIRRKVTADSSAKEKEDFQARFGDREGTYGSKNGVAGMWFKDPETGKRDFVGRNELRSAGYQFDVTEDSRGMESPAGGSFLTHTGKKGEDILRPRPGTLAGLQRTPMVTEAPVPTSRFNQMLNQAREAGSGVAYDRQIDAGLGRALSAARSQEVVEGGEIPGNLRGYAQGMSEAFNTDLSPRSLEDIRRETGMTGDEDLDLVRAAFDRLHGEGAFEQVTSPQGLPPREVGPPLTTTQEMRNAGDLLMADNLRAAELQRRNHRASLKRRK